NDFILFIGFTRMFPFATEQDVHLATPRSKRTGVLPSYAKKKQLRHIPEIKSNPPTIRTSVLAYFVPDKITLIVEAPCFHHFQSSGQESIGTPEVEVRRRVDYLRHGKSDNLFRGHRPVA